MSASRARRLLGVLLLVVLPAGLCVLLVRALMDYDREAVWAAIAGIPADRLLYSALFGLGSYLCLIGFDALAIRYAGRQLTLRRVALASFISLSIAHTIGVAAFSSGAIRYRYYHRWGLNAADVARVILFCTITVTCGLLGLSGVALLASPAMAQQILGLDPDLAVGLGALCLALTAGYLLLAHWLGGRELRIRRFAMEMPGLGLALGQVILGTANFAFVAACLHQALAAVGDTGFAGVAAVYVIANLATLVSHVPGGIGVVESVVVLLLPGAETLGAVLAFRVIYFLAPLAVGVLAFAGVELWWQASDRRNAGLRTDSAAG